MINPDTEHKYEDFCEALIGEYLALPQDMAGLRVACEVQAFIAAEVQRGKCLDEVLSKFYKLLAIVRKGNLS
jgi:hypothetical protein